MGGNACKGRNAPTSVTMTIRPDHLLDRFLGPAGAATADLDVGFWDGALIDLPIKAGGGNAEQLAQVGAGEQAIHGRGSMGPRESRPTATVAGHFL